jgi:RHS repeat-associated protein
MHTKNGLTQPALDQTFGYDNLDRVTSATVSGTSFSYTYDATGNRTSKVIGGAAYLNTVASTSNKLTTVEDVQGSAVLQYDSAGNTTDDGTNTYTYSDRGRIMSALTPSGNASFWYNARNQRVYKTSSLGARYYVYDEKGQLLGEYDGNGSAIYETVYLGATPVGVIKSGGVFNVYSDQINTPRLITAQDNTVVWKWDETEPFGANAPNENPTGAGTFSYGQRFPGQVFDAETGLNQNVNRDYNPRLGRYVQSDPIGLRGGVNPFLYSLGNSVSNFDPLGLLVWQNAPTKWQTDLAAGKSYEVFPGGWSDPIDANVLAIAVGDWGISSACECKSGSTWTFDEYAVRFNAVVHLRSSYSLGEGGEDWVRRAEGDHVSDYETWSKSAEELAGEVEKGLKGTTYASEEECKKATISALNSALIGSFRKVLSLTIETHDKSGKHSYGGRNQRP